MRLRKQQETVMRKKGYGHIASLSVSLFICAQETFVSKEKSE